MKKSYNKSPLKLENGEEKGTTSVEKKPVRVGKYAATKTTTSVREVKKAATGAKVETKQNAPGQNLANLRASRKKILKRKAYPAETRNANRLEAEARAKDAAVAKKPEATGKAEEQMTTGNKVNVELEKAVGSPGTRSSTFKPWEQRQNLRRDRIVVNKEKREGRRGVRNAMNFVRNSADWKKMTSEERAAVKSEIKQGRLKDQKDSALTRFGDDFQSTTEQFRKMKYGQGASAKAKAKYQIEHPEEAADAMMGQGIKNLNPVKTTGFQNLEGIKKEVKAGGPVELSAEEQKSLENERAGTRIEKVTSSKSTETPAPKTNTPNSDAAITKSTNQFAEALKRKDAVLDAKPSDFKSKLAKPEAKPTAEAKFGRGEKMLEEETPLKMRKSNFSLKGFGSKSGYNFNKNK